MKRLFLAVLVTFGCADTPATPTPVPTESEPVEAAASVEVEPQTVHVGEWANIVYRLSAPLPFVVNVPRAATSPTGETNEDTVDFPIGETERRFSTGIYTQDFVDSNPHVFGTWTVRIVGERLPDGVVLGSPSSGSWTVTP